MCKVVGVSRKTRVLLGVLALNVFMWLLLLGSCFIVPLLANEELRSEFKQSFLPSTFTDFAMKYEELNRITVQRIFCHCIEYPETDCG